MASSNSSSPLNPPLPARTVTSVVDQVNAVTTIENKQHYYDFKDSPAPLAPDRSACHHDDPLAPFAPRLFSSNPDAHTTRQPLLSDATVCGAVKRIIDAADGMDFFVGDTIEALDPLTTWYGDDVPHIPTGVHFGRAEKDVEAFHRTNDLERARHLVEGVIGVRVTVAAVHPQTRIGSRDLVLTTLGRVGGRHVEIRLEERPETSALKEVFAQIRLVAENDSDMYMAEKLRSQQGTPAVLSPSLSRSPPPSTSASSASPSPSSSSFTPTPMPTPARTASTGVAPDFLVTEADLSASLAHLTLAQVGQPGQSSALPSQQSAMSSPSNPSPALALSLEPDQQQQQPPSLQQQSPSPQQPKPADWLDWGWADRGSQPAPYGRLDETEKHTLHVIQQLCTQFGVSAYKRSEERRTVDSSEAKRRELFEGEVKGSWDFQLLQSPEESLPLWREGTILRVGRVLREHGDVARYLLAFFLLKMSDALGFRGQPSARIEQLVARLKESPLPSSLYPFPPPASVPPSSTTSTVAATTSRSARRGVRRCHGDSAASVEVRTDSAASVEARTDPMDRSEVGSSSYESAGVSSFESVGADLGSSFFAEQPGFVGKDGDDDLGVPPPASRKTEPPNGSSNLVPASPTDVSNTATLLVDGHLFHRLGANLSTTTTPSRLPTSTTSPLPFSPPASTPAISLDLVLGHGRAADVYSDSTGLLAIKLVEPRIDDVFNPLYDSDPEQASRRYDSRLQEAMREAEAYGKLQGCRVVPAFYGAFEGVDERGYRIVVLVMERLVGKHIAQDQLPQNIDKIQNAVCTVHRYGVLHGDLRIPNILVVQNKIFLLDFGRSRLDPDVRQAETETERVRYWRA